MSFSCRSNANHRSASGWFSQLTTLPPTHKVGITALSPHCIHGNPQWLLCEKALSLHRSVDRVYFLQRTGVCFQALASYRQASWVHFPFWCTFFAPTNIIIVCVPNSNWSALTVWRVLARGVIVVVPPTQAGIGRLLKLVGALVLKNQSIVNGKSLLMKNFFNNKKKVKRSAH